MIARLPPMDRRLLLLALSYTNPLTDMQVAIGDPFFVLTYTNEIKGSHSIEVVYFGRFKNSIDEIYKNPEDHSGYGWFSEAELASAYTENKGPDDIEFKAIRKGFAILRGEAFAT